MPILIERDDHYLIEFQTKITDDFSHWASVLFPVLMNIFNNKPADFIEADKDPDNFDDKVLRVDTEFSIQMNPESGMEAKVVMSVLHVAKKLVVNKTKLRKTFESVSEMAFPLTTIQKRCIPNQLIATK